MLVGFDSTILNYLLNPKARAPKNPATGEVTTHAKERVQGLVHQLQKERHKIIIPSPVLAEILTVIGPSSSDYLQVINRSRVFETRSFDDVSAMELAFLNRDVFSQEDRRNRTDVKQKVKFDRQILAVCKVAGCVNMFTDDGPLANRAKLCGMTSKAIYDLPIPEESRQLRLALEPHEDSPIPEVDDDDAEPQQTEPPSPAPSGPQS